MPREHAPVAVVAALFSVVMTAVGIQSAAVGESRGGVAEDEEEDPQGSQGGFAAGDNPPGQDEAAL